MHVMNRVVIIRKNPTNGKSERVGSEFHVHFERVDEQPNEGIDQGHRIEEENPEHDRKTNFFRFGNVFDHGFPLLNTLRRA